MSNVLDLFREAMNASNVTGLEMSWNLGVKIEEFRLLLSGEKPLNEQQEMVVLKFIFKNLKKDGDLFEIKISQIDPLI